MDDVTETLLLVLVVVTALAFDFTNGFHDTGNAMATSIATKALKPKTAVALSAVLNMVGAFLSWPSRRPSRRVWSTRTSSPSRSSSRGWWAASPGTS